MWGLGAPPPPLTLMSPGCLGSGSGGPGAAAHTGHTRVPGLRSGEGDCWPRTLRVPIPTRPDPSPARAPRGRPDVSDTHIVSGGPAQRPQNPRSRDRHPQAPGGVPHGLAHELMGLRLDLPAGRALGVRGTQRRGQRFSQKTAAAGTGGSERGPGQPPRPGRHRLVFLSSVAVSRCSPRGDDGPLGGGRPAGALEGASQLYLRTANYAAFKTE